MKVKECMCSDICYCTPDTKISEAAKMMKEKHVGCIPVCNQDNYIVGILTDRDIVLRTIACDKDVNNTNVSEVMTNNTSYCDCNDNIGSVIKLMVDTGIRRVPVAENNKIVGIVTIGDFAKHQNISKECVGDTFECISNCNNKNAE